MKLKYDSTLFVVTNKYLLLYYMRKGEKKNNVYLNEEQNTNRTCSLWKGHEKAFKWDTYDII